jgi:hypothetical protein
MVRYWETKGTPEDPWTDRAITLNELEECAKAQGVTFRRGDILLLRIGFIRKYCESTNEERDQLATLEVDLSKLCPAFILCISRAATEIYPCSAGIEPTDDMKRFLW